MDSPRLIASGSGVDPGAAPGEPEPPGSCALGERPPSDADVARGVARKLGVDPDVVEALRGNVNRVFRVRAPGVDWVVRFPADPRRPDEFALEAWAMAAARTCGVPVPEVVHLGTAAGRPVMVQSFVAGGRDAGGGRGRDGTGDGLVGGAGDGARGVGDGAVRGVGDDGEDGDGVGPGGDPWRWLGRYAALIPAAPLDGAPDALFSRFGRDLPLAWRAHVTYNIDSLGAHDPLAAAGGYREVDRPRLRGWLAELAEADFEFGLAHGDLAPRNLVGRVPERTGSTGAASGGPATSAAGPVLIDWATATTGPAPWTDVQRVYQWAVLDGDVSWAELCAFTEAAGVPMTPDVERRLRHLTALSLLDLARWARDRRPDLFRRYVRDCARGVAVLLGDDHDPRGPDVDPRDPSCRTGGYSANSAEIGE